MNTTKYTCQCKECDYQVETTLHGILAPLARPISELRFYFGHALTHHHQKALRLKTAKYALGSLLMFIIFLLLTILRAAAYIFYPFYLLLAILYDE